jgi:hypothetical protein
VHTDDEDAKEKPVRTDYPLHPISSSYYPRYYYPSRYDYHPYVDRYYYDRYYPSYYPVRYWY